MIVKLVTTGGDDELTTRAVLELERLPDAEIQISYGPKSLQEWYQCPFVRGEDGQTYFGLAGIRLFVSERLVQSLPAAVVRENMQKIVTPSKPCPLVMIEWVDSAQPQPCWKFLEDIETPSSIHCVSVGWMVVDGKENKSLAPNMGNINDPSSMQVSGVITIPTRCITKITPLQE